MSVLNRLVIAISIVTLFMSSIAGARDPRPDLVLPDDGRPIVQIALLLDTSNSMDGLINQARSQLWKIVNEFSNCRRDGQIPRLQVALFEYGNDSLPVTEGYIRQVVPLTTDLDLLSEKLFALKTNGGSEYCGEVISVATRVLDWSNDRRAYKAIFIAGNEPFTQGNVDYRSACASAIARGVVVNTIHCGPEDVGRQGQWTDGAKRGEGRSMNIDQDRAHVAIVAPQDEEINRLSVELNVTYIPYGKEGEVASRRQVAQDQLALENAPAGASVERAVAKSSRQYDNARWDLVDAERDGKVDLDKLDAKDLPEAMQTLAPAERRAYVEQQGAKRAEIQAKIKALNEDRVEYVAVKEKENTTTTGTDTLDSAIVKAVREQIAEKGFEMKKEE